MASCRTSEDANNYCTIWMTWYCQCLSRKTGNTSMILRMLAEDAFEHVTDTDVINFKETLILWLNTPVTINEVETANLELKSLKNRKEEDFCSYYNWTQSFLKEAGGQDCQEKNPPQTLSTIECYFSTGSSPKSSEDFWMKPSFQEWLDIIQNPTSR